MFMDVVNLFSSSRTTNQLGLLCIALLLVVMKILQVLEQRFSQVPIIDIQAVISGEDAMH